jgi:hypothetical protein
LSMVAGPASVVTLCMSITMHRMYLNIHYTHIVLSLFLSVPWGISYARPKHPKSSCVYMPTMQFILHTEGK